MLYISFTTCKIRIHFIFFLILKLYLCVLWITHVSFADVSARGRCGSVMDLPLYWSSLPWLLTPASIVINTSQIRGCRFSFFQLEAFEYEVIPSQRVSHCGELVWTELFLILGPDFCFLRWSLTSMEWMTPPWTGSASFVPKTRTEASCTLLNLIPASK